MKCPRDGTHLVPVTILATELNKCPKCNGLWLDRGELERLRKARATDLEEQLASRYANLPMMESTITGYMRCPRCRDARLFRFVYTYTKPISLDRCERCLGIWADCGELDAIIDEGRSLEATKDSSSLTAFFRAMGRDIGREAK